MVESISVHHHMPLPLPDLESHSKPLFAPNKHQDTTSIATSSPSTKVDPNSIISLLDTTITISQFSDAVQTSLGTSKATLFHDDVSTTQLNAKIAKSQADQALNLLANRAEIANLQQEQQTLNSTQNDQINTENAAINTYNNAVATTMPSSNSDQNAVNAMNTAISQYNSGNLSESDFNKAVATYNDYVNSRNATLDSFRNTYNASVSTFQGQVTANNATIANLNALGKTYNIATIPNQTGVPTTASPFPTQAQAPLTIPVSSIPNAPAPIPTIPAIPKATANSSKINFLATYWEPIVKLAMINLSLSDRKQALHQANTDFNLYYIRGKNPTKANAYISDVTPIHFDTSGGIGLGSTGVATSMIGSALDSPHVNGLISSGVFAANAEQFGIRSTQPLLTHFTIFGLRTAANQVLKAALPGMRLIGAPALATAAAGPAFGVALGISSAQITADNINSGVTQQAIASFVNSDLQGKADQKTIDRTTAVLTAQANLFEILTALLVTANTAKLPGLPGQIFGNVNGITPAQLQKQSPQTLAQVLNDPLKQVFLKTTLATQLAQNTKLQQGQAQTQINNAINTTLSEGPLRNAAEFKRRLIQQLVGENVDRHTAVVLANQAQSILNADKTSQHIVNSDLFDRTLATNRLTTQLVKEGYLEADARRLAEAAIIQTQDNAAISNATEFQIALNRALDNLNVNRAKAQAASQATIAALNVVPPGTSPVFNPFALTTLSPAELGREINAHVVQTLSPILGPDSARQIANQAVTAFVGAPAPGAPAGLLALLNQNVETLRRFGDPRIEQKITDQFRQFTLPNVDLLAFSNDLTNPAYTFLHIAATGIMYTPHEIPTKAKRSIDIQV